MLCVCRDRLSADEILNKNHENVIIFVVAVVVVNLLNYRDLFKDISAFDF